MNEVRWTSMDGMGMDCEDWTWVWDGLFLLLHPKSPLLGLGLGPSNVVPQVLP